MPPAANDKPPATARISGVLALTLQSRDLPDVCLKVLSGLTIAVDGGDPVRWQVEPDVDDVASTVFYVRRGELR